MKRHLQLFTLFILILACTALAAAQSRPLVGRVVAITDGDTITVLDSNNTQHRIRLQGIDAPESRQAFGTRSKQNLSNLVFGKQVKVVWNARDRYQRILGKVLLDERDINLEQLRSGMAWYYRAYERDVAPNDRKPYADAETEARAAKLGLWAGAGPTPPWDFRRSERAGRSGDETGTNTVQTTRTPDSPLVREAPVTRPKGQIIGNKNSRKYHLPGCPSYNQVSEKNRVYFRTAGEAEAAGYTKAGNCNK
jgi:endonuclease YncB( thermonuclease family)